MSQLFPSASLASMPEPVLSVYLATNPLRHLNRNCDHGCSRWFDIHARQLLAASDSAAQDPLLRQIKRVQHFLKESIPEAPGIALFAGSDTWHVIPLPSEPENEIDWGKPRLWQLVTMAQSHRPWCIAKMDRSGARLFSFQNGDLIPLAALEFHVDPSHWKQMQAFHSAERNAGMAHGAQRDLFERRYDAQHDHFLCDVAQRLNRICASSGVNHVVLIGPSRSIGILEHKLTPLLRKQTIQIPHLRSGGDSSLSLSSVVEDALRRFEADQKAQKIGELGERGRGVVTGAEETLAMLQRGRLSLLMIEEDFNPVLGYCTTCDHASASPVQECPRCQEPMVERTLHEVLPQLLMRHRCESELVSGQSAERLHKMGGMGGWLRQKHILRASRPWAWRETTIPMPAAVA
ncbi:MAG: VLRF1 family aeRF1-type release factor [Acidobacteriota bacterium]